MSLQDTRARSVLVFVCFGTMVMAGSAYFLLQSFPSLRVGITLTLFGVGFIVLACVSLKTGVTAWRLGAVSRCEQPMFFGAQVIYIFLTGIALIVFGWIIQVYIVNAPPPPNPLPPEHPEYEYYNRKNL